MSDVDFMCGLIVFSIIVGLILIAIILIIPPLSVLYILLSAPFWWYVAEQANKGVISKDYVKNLPLGKLLISPFQFYYCLFFRKPYHF
jgi:hypothetical protein